jgi:hypothetical protein
VNGLLDNGISARGIASGVVDMGGTLDPDVVSRHKNNGHWQPKQRTEGPKPTKRDLATLVRDKVADAVEDLSPEALLLMGKDLGPMVGKGLQAEAILDKREVNEKRLGIAAGALSLQAWLAGLGASTAPPLELDDGNTIDGEAVEVP